jgi:hypothetical protein
MLDRIATAYAEAAALAWEHVALPIIDLWATIAALPLPIALAAAVAGLAAASAVCDRTNR